MVDAKESGYQCVKYPDTRFFLSYEQGKDLKCVSPTDLELGLKACKQHSPLPDYTICELDLVRQMFYCKLDSASAGSFMSPQEVDNFFCLSDQDRRRILERCKYPQSE